MLRVSVAPSPAASCHRSSRRRIRVSCIAAPERPSAAPLTIRSLPATTDRTSSGRQASAPPAPIVRAPPARQPVPPPAKRNILSKREFDWASENGYNAKARSRKIWTFALTLQARLWFLDKKWSYPGGFTAEKEVQRRRTLAAWIRENLLELGPTFIKLGQLFSARSDLLPKEVTEELSLLQDQVPVFSPEKAAAIIREELGASPEELFTVFDAQPLAAASLGQVHYAQLKSGQQVVVKVQRPGLRQLFEIDLATLKDIAVALDKQDSSRDFKGISDECSVILLEEIDYILEGRNADRFRRDFAPYPWVRVPTVHWRYTSPRVVTLEYMPGAKISDVQSHLARATSLPS